MQPIVATLILMVAGRGVAQLITGGQIITVHRSSSYLRRQRKFSRAAVSGTVEPCNAGHYRRSDAQKQRSDCSSNRLVTIRVASIYAGVNGATVKFLVYVFSGFCAGLAGLVAASNIKVRGRESRRPVSRVGCHSRRGRGRHGVDGRALLSGGRNCRRALHPGSHHDDVHAQCAAPTSLRCRKPSRYWQCVCSSRLCCDARRQLFSVEGVMKLPISLEIHFSAGYRGGAPGALRGGLYFISELRLAACGRESCRR